MSDRDLGQADRRDFGGAPASTLRPNALVVDSSTGDELAYVAGSLQGQTAFSPDFADKQTGAFVARLDAGGAVDGQRVYPGGAEVAREAGVRSLALAGGASSFQGVSAGRWTWMDIP